MRWVLRIGLALLLLLGAALLALALALPPLARSQAVRERLEQEAQRAAGRPVHFGEIDLGLLPPRLVVRDLRVAGEESEPSFRAREVALRLALLPLLARVVLVDSVVVRGADVVLLRTEAGLVHPFSGLAESRPGGGAEPPGGSPASGDAERAQGPGGVSFAVRRALLEDARVTVRDRTRKPELALTLEKLTARSTAVLTRRALDFALSGELASGGHLSATGQAQLGGDARAELRLDAVEVAPLAPYLGSAATASGKLAGTVTLVREADALGADLELGWAEARLESGTLTASGPLQVRAHLVPEQDQVRGRLELDAAGADLRAGARFKKPAETPARLAGPFRWHRGRLRMKGAQLQLGALETPADLDLGPRSQVSLGESAFDASALAPFLPDLARLQPVGAVRVDGLEVTVAPTLARGGATVAALHLHPPGAPELVLDGSFTLAGNVLDTRGLEVRVADQPLRLDARVQGIPARPHFDARISADGVDSRALISAFAPDFDRLEGPLAFQAQLRGPLGGSRPLAEQIQGRLRLRVAPGRLRGVSLIQKAFEQPGESAAAALLRSRAGGLRDYHEDDFESLTGNVVLAAGRARSEDLRLVYRHYRVDLAGSVGVVDRRLDLQGELTIDPAVDATLSGSGDAAGGHSRVIPLAHVGGTLDDPRVELGDDALLRIGSAYLRDERRRRKWERKLDERLGEGAGKDVLDALDQVLRGKSR